MKKKSIRILLVDDHEVVRDGVAALIDQQSDMEVVHMVGTGRSAVKLAAITHPDLVIMDITMPDLNGIDATRQIREADPSCKVLCLSMHGEQSLIGSMLRAGAAGYLIKNCAGRELVDAVRSVMSGQTYISPMVAGTLVDEFVCNRDEPAGSVYSEISGREREVLQLIAEGVNTKEIASRLSISDKTVAAHRLSLLEKLDCECVADLTRYAIRQGIVQA
jgi:DNA-binding NarL/FixJ family response regulator